MPLPCRWSLCVKKNMKEIKILFLSNMYPRGTNTMSGVFIHRQVENLVRLGCRVKVCSPLPWVPYFLQNTPSRKGYRQTPAHDELDGIPVYYPRYFCLPGNWFHAFTCFTVYQSVIHIIRKIIVDFKPDIIHAHTATPDGYAGILLKQKISVPLVCTLRGDDVNLYLRYPFTPSLTRKVILGADQILAVSNDLKSRAESLAVPKNEIRVIYNGVNLEEFHLNRESRPAIREKLNIPLNAKILIYIGAIMERKGAAELARAFIGLNRRYPDLYLIIMGNGPMESVLAAEFAATGVNNKVRFMEIQPHREIPKFLNASDLLVLPSYAEGLPNVVVEAMACGLPVVATAVGGTPEAVVDGRTGFLTAEKDARPLADKIGILLDNPLMMKDFGTAALGVAKEKFDSFQNAKKLKKIYEGLIF